MKVVFMELQTITKKKQKIDISNQLIGTRNEIGINAIERASPSDAS